MSETIHPFKLCRIADSNGDLSKPWYVEYYVWDETNEKLTRKRYVLAQKTAKERYAKGKENSIKIDSWLKNGDLINRKPKPKNAPITKSSTILEAIETFLAFTEKTNQKRTYECYSSDLKNFKQFIESNNLKDLQIEQFDEVYAHQYLDSLSLDGKSNSRRNNLKGTIGTLFNYYKTRKIINVNPFSEIKNLNTVVQKHAAYSKKEIKLIKDECLKTDTQLWLFISFIYYTAIRPGEELRRLKINDIKEKTILIDGNNAKNNKSQHITIPAPLQKIINEHKLRVFPKDHYVFSNGGPGERLLGKHLFYDRHVLILKKLGLSGKNFDLYAWKHTGCIALFQATQNIELIRNHCRHSDIATTQKYLRDLGLFTDYTLTDKFPEI